jgi:Putative beta barrel porin-7 (BBP7)
MRNGILWVIPAVLASVSAVVAQPAPTWAPVVPVLEVKFAPTSEPPVNLMPNATARQEEAALPPPMDLFEPAPQQQASPLSVTADYLLWWTKGGPLNTPLVSTGSLGDIPPGALGQPTTQILYGDHPMSYGALSGMRFGAAYDLGCGLAVEGNYFVLTTGVARYQASSDANGNPRITRPFFNNQFNQQDSLGVAEPSALLGPFAGNIAISSHSQLQGWELNVSSSQRINDRLTFVALAGFRALQLDEDLGIQENLAQISPGVLTFLAQPINVGDTLYTFDRFHTSNNFYGGQIGGRLEWQGNVITVSALGKVAFGVNQQVATIDGGSVWNSAAGIATAPGGVLALPSNMGRYYRSSFSVVPEVGLNIAWKITPRITATAGYNFLYWTQVARPGAQIDANLNPAITPTNQLYGNGQGSNRPAFNFQGSDYWAQGISFGLEFKF